MNSNRIVFLTDGSRLGSSQCRGYDIAEKLNMPIDIPVNEIKKNDTVIMIKKFEKNVLLKTDRVYCDVVDGAPGLYPSLSAYPKIKIITLSSQGKWYLKSLLPKNKIIWIPHSHCNNEKTVRPDREVKRIIYNGTAQGFPISAWNKFQKKAKKEGFEVVRMHTVSNRENKKTLREKCCEEYYNSDIQVAFRHQNNSALPLIMKCATKLNNAGSFLIPSVAYPEPAFEYNYNEKGYYIPVKSIEEMVNMCIKLRDDYVFYSYYAYNAWYGSRKYHINRILKYYENL